MKMTMTNWAHPKQAIDALFYIKNHSDDEPDFQEKCQEMINLLFERFPGLMPLPNRPLAEQSKDVTDIMSAIVRRV